MDSPINQSPAADDSSYFSTFRDILDREEASIPWSDVSFAKVAAYGSCFYIVENALLHPAEVLKTRLQVDSKSPETFANVKKEIGLIHRENGGGMLGLQGFYRAFSFNAILSIPAQIAYISTYSALKEGMEGTPLALAAPLLAGGLAEVAGATCYVPVDIVVARVITQSAASAPRLGGLEMARKIYREEGVRQGFFRGYNAHLWTYVPSSALWWAAYEGSKKLLYKHYPHTRGLESQLLSGCVAGVVVGTFMNPLEITKTRLQTQIGASECRTIYGTLRRMCVEEGVRSLAKGLLPKLIFSVPISALTSLLYETVMTLSQK